VPRRADRPAAERLDDRLGFQAPGRRFIDLHRRRRRQAQLARQAPRLKLIEPLREHIGADAGKVALELRETARAEHQLAQHQQRPAFADQIERVGGSASVVIAAFCLGLSLFGYFF